jgi:UDP-GlcNAc:undecaprenyl-phosphate GlcNAc-1-phosphate transferase
MGRYTLVFTTLVTVSMINAYNFIDGADGLAGSLAMVAFLSIAAGGGLHLRQALIMFITYCAAVDSQRGKSWRS